MKELKLRSLINEQVRIVILESEIGNALDKE